MSTDEEELDETELDDDEGEDDNEDWSLIDEADWLLPPLLREDDIDNKDDTDDKDDVDNEDGDDSLLCDDSKNVDDEVEMLLCDDSKNVEDEDELSNPFCSSPSSPGGASPNGQPMYIMSPLPTCPPCTRSQGG